MADFQVETQTCSVDGCTLSVRARSWCNAHYLRWRAEGDVLADVPIRTRSKGRKCVIEGCDQSYWARGWCSDHYERWRRWGDPQAELRRARNGEGSRGLNQDGYVRIRTRGEPGKNQRLHIFEHRKVMEEMLGRKLIPGETVHHKNGVRHDNRPENLELWVSTRSGQRVADLVAFVVEHYRAEVEVALNT